MADYDGSVTIGVDLDTGDVLKDIKELVAEINSTLKRMEGGAGEVNKIFNNATKNVDEMNQALHSTSDIMSNVRSETSDIFKSDSFGSALGIISDIRDAAREIIYYMMQLNYNLQNNNKYVNLLRHDFKMLETDVFNMTEAVGNLDPVMNQIFNIPKGANLQNLFRAATHSAEEYEDELDDVSSGQNRVISTGKRLVVLTKIFNALKTTVKSIPEIFKKMQSTIQGVFKNIQKGAKSSETSLKRMLKSMMKYVLGFRSMYFLVRKIRTYGVEAMQALALESEKVNKDLSRLLTVFMQLKYSMASFIQPIVSIAVPALEKLAEAGIRASEAVGKVFAVLAGQNYIYKANKVQRDYAESLQKTAKAAKEAKKQLGEYDKLNVIKKDSDSDTSGLEDGLGGDLFSKELFDTSKYQELIDKIKDMWKKADFTELGLSIGTKIKQGLDKIDWASIKNTLGKVGKSVATFLNGIFSTPGLSATLGTTLGESLNSAIEIAFKFVRNFNWIQAGWFLANGINQFVHTVDWAKLGQTIHDTVAGIFDLFITFVEETDWEQVGEAIGTFISNLDIGDLSFKLGTLLWEVIKGAFNVLKGMFETAPLETTILLLFAGLKFTGLKKLLLLKLGTMFADVGSGIWLFLKTSLGTVMTNLGTWLSGIGTQLAALGPGILAGIVADLILVVMAVKNWIKLFKMNLEPGELVNAVFDFLWGETQQIFAGFKEKFDKTGEDIIKFFKDLFNGDFSKLPEDFIQFGEDLIDGLILGITGAISFLFEPLKQMATAVIDWVKELFGIHSPSTVFEGFGTDLIQGLINGILALKDKLVNTFTDIFNGVTEAVNKFKENFKKGLEGIKTVVKPVVNSIIGIFNKFIDLLNGTINAISDAFGKFKIDVPDWIPGIGGKKYSFSLPKVNLKKIPALAEGAVIPPNKKFLAQLGDQKQGTNIEAPLETIKQALMEAMAANNNNSSNTIDLTINLDGTVVYNRMVEIDKAKIKQNGRSGFGGGR